MDAVRFEAGEERCVSREREELRKLRQELGRAGA